MNLIPTFSWLASLKWQRPHRVAPLDFADMGTAFGLDASLDSMPPLETVVAMKKGRPETGAPQRRLSRVGLREGR